MSDTALTVARKSCPGKEVMARRRVVEIGDWTQFTVTDPVTSLAHAQSRESNDGLCRTWYQLRYSSSGPSMEFVGWCNVSLCYLIYFLHLFYRELGHHIDECMDPRQGEEVEDIADQWKRRLMRRLFWTRLVARTNRLLSSLG
jgi:hypothetical protein